MPSAASPTIRALSGRGAWVAAWGILGVALVLTQALVRLVPVALIPIATGMTSLQWTALALWVAFCAYSEGYKAFQLRWVPRVVARAFHLGQNPRPLHVVLAPFFCMGLLHATRRRLIVSWAFVVLITLVVVLVRRLAQPWRGIIDGGVVVGLGWGLVALLWQATRAGLSGAPPEASPELP
ncbi:MAG: hypothetical protein H7Y32_15860 [Chloroflexales bacterium]|nr:hypothetical protein [Chloroflexales bacterium]